MSVVMAPKSSLPQLLELVRRVLPGDGDRLATKLAATTDSARVTAVLSDERRPRAFATPVAGRVQVIGGKLVDFKLTGFRVLIGEQREPTANEIKEVIRLGSGNPLGSWIGTPDFGWLVLEPRELLVAANTDVDAGTEVVICPCTLDHRMEIFGLEDVKRCIAHELPELQAAEAALLGDAMAAFVEAYDSLDDNTSRTHGTLMRVSELVAYNEQHQDAMRYARARVLSLPELARQPVA
jgi:hypothetical protein